MAWIYRSGDARTNNLSQIQCNPLIVDGVLYGTSPGIKLFALDAATGRELWRFDPFAAGGANSSLGVNRGVVFWREGNDRRVLFTADPVSGDLMHMTGNAVRGLGEQLVSGQAQPLAFTIAAQSGAYSGPPELKPFARQLHRLALRLDRDMGCPQDIEWALARGKIAILQTRPITTLREFNPATGEINSSLAGAFLWSNGNAAEIQPDVMTLLSWSVLQLWGHGYSARWRAARNARMVTICRLPSRGSPPSTSKSLSLVTR